MPPTQSRISCATGRQNQICSLTLSAARHTASLSLPLAARVRPSVCRYTTSTSPSGAPPGWRDPCPAPFPEPCFDVEARSHPLGIKRHADPVAVGEAVYGVTLARPCVDTWLGYEAEQLRSNGGVEFAPAQLVDAHGYPQSPSLTIRLSLFRRINPLSNSSVSPCPFAGTPRGASSKSHRLRQPPRCARQGR